MADEASQRESWWVLQAQSGSHEALNELFKSVQEPLFRYLVMPENVDLDSVRAAALARIDRSERNFKLAFIGAGIVECAFVAGFLLLADLSNRLHLLLLISTVSCYSIVVLGLVALGAHFNRGIARLLKALELRTNVD